MPVPVYFRQRIACASLLCLFSQVVVPAAELRVRQVTLYKHGLGLFERDGVVCPGEDVRLDFQNGDMNDLLKSLTVTDAGGRVTAVRYDANETLDQRLSKFPFHLAVGESLSAFLDSVKGSKLEATAGGKQIIGSVLGARQLPATSAAPGREQLTLLLQSGDLMNLDLGDLTSIRLLDPHQQDQLKAYLQALAESSAHDKRSVYIQSDAKDSRHLRGMYIAPVPIWKSSYRLMLNEASPVLEGWAIVDNTTGEDWNYVHLSVVSGRPISFISPLYTARYAQRQVAELQQDHAPAPIVYGGSLDASAQAGSAGGVIGGMIGGVGDSNGAGGVYRPFVANRLVTPKTMNKVPGPTPPPAQAPTVEVTSSSVQGATGETIGELFEYDFPGAITIKKNESAMLPFLQSKVTARKLLIYTDQDSEHPVNAAELTNTTPKTLDGGPVTVYDGGAYAGEALLETLKAGDKRLIGYAVDYGTRLSTEFETTDRPVREVHVSNGVLTTKAAELLTKTYTVRNVDPKPKTLIVQQSVGEGRLVSPQPLERTAKAWRFQVDIGANTSNTLQVVTEKFASSEIELGSATPDDLLLFVRNKELPATERAQLKSIVDLKSQIAEASASNTDLRRQLDDLNTEQSRLRSNIETLNRVSGEENRVHEYSTRLATLESRFTQLSDQSRAGEIRRQALQQQQLNRAIESLDF